ncbi:2-polyprenyl-6-methoxyphenol hydroxylase-like FAD-dependent oxidoreductase [Actinoplanes lutulentus]|uniref:2-polyprenyl-6-methoxyphenol hydroxylase-like FAD-dependent oxidoreductase n=1 Tax=Actinoplanes lutulentus TaxID=1287878 RepID=A0A327ZGV6_9ACTN|nr:FAD-dependent monooxygenase [Actinoplanes lutulentus]MBB2948085.1 2-polyprenyl-6-methoxyphenol hydroxylase-like FAD-dependent oxidoreductase [Actinoplanes lutulentus]RAK40034.1 2-polyprenyl-6-methoxyphenol hydroxylase-like FAD-dependent oxidoreductase [Actinoplanes lutulentus]
MAELSCEVLVVGAGPTGLMLANWLTRLGVDVIVTDTKDGPTRESRALVVQARSLEIYDQLGIGDHVLEAARRAEAFAPGFGPRAFGRVPLGPLGLKVTPYPFIEILEQSRNEEILYDNLRKLGGEVHWENPVTAVVQTEQGISAKIGNDTVSARFCVGCDGANSVVRRARRIGFDGVTNPHRFFVLDAAGVSGLQERAINARPNGTDFMVAFPMRGDGNWRLIGAVRDGDLDEDDARDRLSRIFNVKYEKSRWFATYKVHHRVAAAFRDGPFFLAGDAAHVHSPIGGQGMNTGLQDAHNLAFKLADVLRGKAKDTWLDRYEAERRPVARKLVATTDRLFGLITSSRLPARTLRRLAVPLIAPIGVRLLPRSSTGTRLFQYVSQTRIHYRGTSSEGRRDPVVGRRLPWSGDNYAVLRAAEWQVHAYGGVTAEEVPDLGISVHLFPAAPGTALRPGLLYLVRPDGFVAARSEPAEAELRFRYALAR